MTHLAPLVPLRVLLVLLDLGRAFRLGHGHDSRGELLLLFQTAVVLVEVAVPPLDVVSVLSDGLDDLVQLILRLVVNVVPFVHFDRAEHLVVVLLRQRDLVVWKYSRALQREVFGSRRQGSIFDSAFLILDDLVDQIVAILAAIRLEAGVFFELPLENQSPPATVDSS